MGLQVREVHIIAAREEDIFLFQLTLFLKLNSLLTSPVGHIDTQFELWQHLRDIETKL